MSIRTTLTLFAVGVLVGTFVAGFNAAAYADEGECPIDGGNCTANCWYFGSGCECTMVSCDAQNECRYTSCMTLCCESGKCIGPDCGPIDP